MDTSSPQKAALSEKNEVAQRGAPAISSNGIEGGKLKNHKSFMAKLEILLSGPKQEISEKKQTEKSNAGSSQELEKGAKGTMKYGSAPIDYSMLEVPKFPPPPPPPQGTQPGDIPSPPSPPQGMPPGDIPLAPPPPPSPPPPLLFSPKQKSEGSVSALIQQRKLSGQNSFKKVDDKAVNLMNELKEKLDKLKKSSE